MGWKKIKNTLQRIQNQTRIAFLLWLSTEMNTQKRKRLAHSFFYFAKLWPVLNRLKLAVTEVLQHMWNLVSEQRIFDDF